MITVGLFVLGLIALIVGAELIVRCGTRVAARLGVSPIVIGLTIVSVGTSTPELAVGIESALQGNGSLAVGNIAGTNTVNILLILGLSALLRPLAIQMSTLRLDLPVITVVAVAFLLMSWNGVLTRTEGALMVSAGIIYTAVIVRSAQRESRKFREEFEREYGPKLRNNGWGEILWNTVALIAGIGIVVVGSDWLVDAAVEIARKLGVSDAFIGLTIVAIGTSSPELVTTVIGTLRNDRDIAIGNLLGSSIYNILFILGITCLVPSAGVAVEPDLIYIDIPVMTAVALVCVPVFLSGRQVTRFEGGAFVVAYVTYLVYLIVSRT